jgi:hypothetical protein
MNTMSRFASLSDDSASRAAVGPLPIQIGMPNTGAITFQIQEPKAVGADQRTALRSTASCRRPMAPGRSFTSNSQKIAIRTTTHPK